MVNLVLHQMTQQTVPGGSIILRGTYTKRVVFDSLCNKTSNLFLLKPSVFALSVWLRCSISGHSGADGTGSGSQRWESGMCRRLAPARMPEWAGHRALFHRGHVVRPGSLYHAEALAQERQPQLDLQHFQKSGVIIWILGGQTLVLVYTGAWACRFATARWNQQDRCCTSWDFCLCYLTKKKERRERFYRCHGLNERTLQSCRNVWHCLPAGTNKKSLSCSRYSITCS